LRGDQLGEQRRQLRRRRRRDARRASAERPSTCDACRPWLGTIAVSVLAASEGMRGVKPAGGARRRRSRTRSTASWWRRYGIGRPNPGAVAGSAIPPSLCYHGRAERPSADRRVAGTGEWR
jgi:hypothetical protein